MDDFISSKNHPIGLFCAPFIAFFNSFPYGISSRGYAKKLGVIKGGKSEVGLIINKIGMLWC